MLRYRRRTWISWLPLQFQGLGGLSFVLSYTTYFFQLGKYRSIGAEIPLMNSWCQRSFPRKRDRQVHSTVCPSHFLVQHRALRATNPPFAGWRRYDGLLSVDRRCRYPQLGSPWRTHNCTILSVDLLLLEQLCSDWIRLPCRDCNSSTSSKDRWICRSLYSVLWYLHQLCHTYPSFSTEGWMEL